MHIPTCWAWAFHILPAILVLPVLAQPWRAKTLYASDQNLNPLGSSNPTRTRRLVLLLFRVRPAPVLQDSEQDGRSRPLFRGNFELLSRRFPIVEPDPGHTKLRLSKEGLEAIERIKTPIAAVAVIGPYRSGKSFLLNQLLSLSCYEGLHHFSTVNLSERHHCVSTAEPCCQSFRGYREGLKTTIKRKTRGCLCFAFLSTGGWKWPFDWWIRGLRRGRYMHVCEQRRLRKYTPKMNLTRSALK
ncbi:uncharacterized protein LOC112203767 [Rosa chinensis]|uniref:uncharacterized protein LOC112203767 n=1 Tax=Rosa chinensis TaxID=74649 RepID=UPI000D089043|nr:uncharacterized protein LOC112203767 [Rosa chinensis]